MKMMMCFLLLNLFMFTTHSLLYTGSNVIYDTAGKKLLRGNPYYVLPLLPGSGGGLTLSRNNKDACPLNVTQEPSDFSQGVPFTFKPIVLDEQAVRASYPTSIEAEVTSPCRESNIWKVSAAAPKSDEDKLVMDGNDRKKQDDDHKDLVAVQIVTTGGELNTPESCFQIVENDMMPGLQSYQIQHCPFKCGFSAALTCYNIGVISDANGKRYLAPTYVLFPVVFENSFGKFSQSATL